MKKYLLIIATTFPRNKFDQKIPLFVYDLAKQQSKKFKIIVLTPHAENLKTKEIFDKDIIVYRFRYFIPKFEKIAYGSGTIDNIKKNKFLLLLIPFYIIGFSIKFLYLILRYNIKLIHLHWIIPFGPIVMFFKKFFKYKVLLTLHGGDVYDYKQDKALKLIPTNFLIKFSLLNADFITCVNKDIKKNILKRFDKKQQKKIKNKIKILPMGVNIKDFSKNKLKKHENILKILFIGRLAFKKGVSYLINAIYILKNKGYDPQCTIAGDGNLLNKLKKQVNDLKLNNNCKFIGFIKHNKIYKLFETHDIFVFPSSEKEGAPVVLLEAMASFIPIISTNSTDLINDKIAYIVEKKNSQQIANAIIKALKNKKLTNQKLTNAKKYVYQYDIKKIGLKYNKILKNL